MTIRHRRTCSGRSRRGSRRGQRARLAEDLAGLPRDELVLTGDFNLSPWSFALMRAFDRQLLPLLTPAAAMASSPSPQPGPYRSWRWTRCSQGPSLEEPSPSATACGRARTTIR